MITIAADSEGTADQRVKDAFFIVEPNQKQLVEIAQELDAGQLRAFVKTTVPLNEASAAYGGAFRDKSGFGKIVITVSSRMGRCSATGLPDRPESANANAPRSRAQSS
jgi:hypothetical protein